MDQPCPRSASRWMKDLFSLEANPGESGKWLIEAIGRKIRDGSKVSFWNDLWVGTTSLKDLFPRLFQMSNRKEGMVNELGSWRGEQWVWQWGWRLPFFAWEEDMFRDFQEVLVQVAPLKNGADSWCWKPDSCNGFSVKSAYGVLIGLRCNVCFDPLFVWLANLFGSVISPQRYLSLLGDYCKISCQPRSH